MSHTSITDTGSIDSTENINNKDMDDFKHVKENIDIITDVHIEIPFGSNMKYELDKKTGLLRCDRQ